MWNATSARRSSATRTAGAGAGRRRGGRRSSRAAARRRGAPPPRPAGAGTARAGPRRRGPGRRAPGQPARVHLDALHAAGRRVLLQHVAREVQLRELAHAAARVARMASVWSRLRLRLDHPDDAAPRARGAASRAACRGPTSTSGQTGTHSTKRPSSSVRKRSRLWPPSHRTFSPSRQDETPMRSRSSRSLMAAMVARRARRSGLSSAGERTREVSCARRWRWPCS